MKSSCASSAANRTATPPCSFAASATRRAWNTSDGCFERACSRGSAEQETSSARAERRSNFIQLLSRHTARRAKQFHKGRYNFGREQASARNVFHADESNGWAIQKRLLYRASLRVE